MSDDDSTTISREEKVMKNFLEGKLHLGSSMSIIQYGRQVSFALKGKEAMKLSKWWRERGVHPNRRTMNAHLLIHKNPPKELPQLSRDIRYRRAPYNHLTITLTPAELLDSKGKVKTCSVNEEHRNIPEAPMFPLHDIDRSVGHMNLLRFIDETLEYQKKLDEIEAVRKANWRPFITPIRVDPIQPSLSFSDYLWKSKEEEEAEPDEAIVREADSIAIQAVVLYHSQQSQQSSISLTEDSDETD